MLLSALSTPSPSGSDLKASRADQITPGEAGSSAFSGLLASLSGDQALTPVTQSAVQVGGPGVLKPEIPGKGAETGAEVTTEMADLVWPELSPGPVLDAPPASKGAQGAAAQALTTPDITIPATVEDAPIGADPTRYPGDPQRIPGPDPASEPGETRSEQVTVQPLPESFPKIGDASGRGPDQPKPTPSPTATAPEPLGETAPEPLRETAPEPLREITPEPLGEIAPKPLGEIAPETVSGPPAAMAPRAAQPPEQATRKDRPILPLNRSEGLGPLREAASAAPDGGDTAPVKNGPVPPLTRGREPAGQEPTRIITDGDTPPVTGPTTGPATGVPEVPAGPTGKSRSASEVKTGAVLRSTGPGAVMTTPPAGATREVPAPEKAVGTAPDPVADLPVRNDIHTGQAAHPVPPAPVSDRAAPLAAPPTAGGEGLRQIISTVPVTGATPSAWSGSKRVGASAQPAAALPVTLDGDLGDASAAGETQPPVVRPESSPLGVGPSILMSGQAERAAPSAGARPARPVGSPEGAAGSALLPADPDNAPRVTGSPTPPSPATGLLAPSRPAPLSLSGDQPPPLSPTGGVSPPASRPDVVSPAGAAVNVTSAAALATGPAGGSPEIRVSRPDQAVLSDPAAASPRPDTAALSGGGSTGPQVAADPAPVSASALLGDRVALSRHVSRQLRLPAGGEVRTQITLRPDGLGTVEVDLTTDPSGRLSVLLRVENPAVLQALRADRDLLLMSLDQTGMDLDGAQLDFQGFGAESDRRSDERGARTGPYRTATDLTEMSALPAGPATRAPLIGGGRIDLFT